MKSRVENSICCCSKCLRVKRTFGEVSAYKMKTVRAETLSLTLKASLIQLQPFLTTVDDCSVSERFIVYFYKCQTPKCSRLIVLRVRAVRFNLS